MKKIKSFLLIAFVLVLNCSTLAFAKEAEFAYDSGTIKEEAESYFNDIVGLTDNDIEYILSNSNSVAIQKGVESFDAIKDNLGEFKKVDNVEVEEDGDKVYVYVTGKFKDADSKMTVTYKSVFDQATMTGVSFELINGSDGSFGKRMLNASLNTVLGLFTVFVVLILIAFIISLFRFIPKIQAAFEKKADNKTEINNAVDNTIAQIAEKENDQNLADDLELVAVISAAIAAYEGTGSDGFVVRSINRRSTNKWRNY